MLLFHSESQGPSQTEAQAHIILPYQITARLQLSVVAERRKGKLKPRAVSHLLSLPPPPPLPPSPAWIVLFSHDSDCMDINASPKVKCCKQGGTASPLLVFLSFSCFRKTSCVISVEKESRGTTNKKERGMSHRGDNKNIKRERKMLQEKQAQLLVMGGGGKHVTWPRGQRYTRG